MLGHYKGRASPAGTLFYGNVDMVQTELQKVVRNTKRRQKQSNREKVLSDINTKMFVEKKKKG